MKSMSPRACRLILCSMICTACADMTQVVTPTDTLAVRSSIGESVIESILSISFPETPWRLDNAWQGGELGGAVFRATSIEHVVRQNAKPLFQSVKTNETVGIEQLALVETNTAGKFDVDVTDPELTERAWRKYCHHQLDMTADEHTLVAHTQIPHNILNRGCNPGSLKK